MDYKFLEVAEHYIVHAIGHEELFNKDSIIIDCGACVGNFTQPLWDKFHCNFYLYEPDPRNFRQLRYRFSIYPEIRLKKLAIAAFGRDRKFYTGRFETASSLEPSHRGLDGNSIEVETISLDEIIMGFKYIDLIKLDIEGEEIHTIPNLDILQIRKVRQFVVEFHLQAEIDGYTEDKVLDCRKFLQDKGFREVKYEPNIGTNKGQEATYLNENWTL